MILNADETCVYFVNLLNVTRALLGSKRVALTGIAQNDKACITACWVKQVRSRASY